MQDRPVRLTRARSGACHGRLWGLIRAQQPLHATMTSPRAGLIAGDSNAQGEVEGERRKDLNPQWAVRRANASALVPTDALVWRNFFLGLQDRPVRRSPNCRLSMMSAPCAQA
jgi:hypothetical protein